MTNIRRSALLAVALLAGCAAPVKEQAHTGFISDYSKLEKVADNAYQFTGSKVGDYDSFIIDSPEILFDRGAVKDLTDEDIDELAAYLRKRLKSELTKNEGYTVVTEPGPGVARLRLGISALDATIGALNLTIYTKITGAGLGGAAMEGEMVDSVTGEQLAAAVQWGSGSRVLRAGYTKLGDAKMQINRWTKNLRARVDHAHGL